MTKKRVKYIAKVVSAVTAVSFAMAIFGHGCGNLKSNNGSGKRGSLAGTCGDDGFEKISVTLGEDTLGLLYGTTVMANMAACMSLPDAAITTKTVEEFNNRASAFSEYGNGIDVTAPMLMGTLAVVGEMCDDLYDYEAALPSADRAVFVGWDFAVDSSQGCPGESQMIETISRMAVSQPCWGANDDAVPQSCEGLSGNASNVCRMEANYSEELQVVLGGINRMMNETRDNVTEEIVQTAGPDGQPLDVPVVQYNGSFKRRACAVSLCAMVASSVKGILR